MYFLPALNEIQFILKNIKRHQRRAEVNILQLVTETTDITKFVWNY